MAKITWTDKVTIDSKPEIAEINKVTDSNMNEIKTVVNGNDDQVITNTAGIATNAGDIATNSGNIATNTGNIATNTANIATNTSNIANKLDLSGGTMTGAILGDQEIRGFRPVAATITTNQNLENISPNSFSNVDTTSNSVTISVTDTANSNYPIGTEFEFSPIDLTNDADFAPLGSQVIQSLEGNLKLNGVYSGSILKKVANNTWRLIGNTKA